MKVLLKEIQRNSNNTNHFIREDAALLKGDSLENLKHIPDRSVSLILTDPPYHSTKKKNIFGDTFFREDEEFIKWMEKYSNEWKRVLKPNGSVFVFCSAKMASKLEMIFSKRFNVLSHIVWTKPNAPGFDGWKQKMKKESLRQWYSHSERIIFMEPAIEGNLNRSYFGDLLRSTRIKVGMSGHELTEIVGAYGKVNHGGAVSNWEAGRNVPSREQYEKIKKALLNTEKIDSFPDYEDAIRPFKVNGSMEFTDIWTFENIRPYKGKHPAEKPIELLEHAIKATTFEKDIVLDCFAGSGSTCIASLKLKRRTIAMEIDEKWIQQIEELLRNYDQAINKYSNNYQEPLHSIVENQLKIKV